MTGPKQPVPEDLLRHCDGKDALWLWFGLSGASFLALPRVLMHEMPDEWQGRMAELLREYDAAFPNQPDISSRVQITDLNGRLIPTPSWLTSYRHPDLDMIASLRGSS